MVFGNTFLKCSKAGFLVICVKATYSEALNTNTAMITVKLNEKIMNSKEPITAVIIRANSDMGKPIITARFRMFL
jgi:hypothetical protein